MRAVSSDLSSLSGKRVLAIAIGCDLARGVADGAEQLGAKVARVGEGLNLSSRESVAAGIDAAVAEHGVPELVVLSIVPEAAMRPVAIADASEADWRAAAMEGLRTTVRVLQALGPHLKAKGGAVVFVAPSLSLVGTPEMVALTTLLEGQRGLMKSVARQWGGAGVTLNWIAAAPRALAPFADVVLASRPDAVSVALGHAPDPATEIAPALAFLAGDAGRAMTGATLMLDGGEWMVP
jgi:NAD(P)-dependent dehydrogenase (short-subunit alcohol dehydrogenase family)